MVHPETDAASREIKAEELLFLLDKMRTEGKSEAEIARVLREKICPSVSAVGEP